MYDRLTPSMIVAALSRVKEFHIDLIDLTWKLVKEDGSLDETQMALCRQEIEEAADQASAYVTSVRETVDRLFRFRKHK